MTSIEMKRLARRIAKIEREQANQGKPQLAYSSIENGNLKSYEGDDLKMIVGLQDDGGQTTQVFNGPTPPTPVGFTVDVDHGKFIVHWSGDFDGDKLAPSDWSRAEVHASQDPFFVPDRTTARGSIVSAAGGEVTIGVLKGPWTIKMLAWSQAGKMSAPSAPVDVEVPGYGEIVLEEIDAAETAIKNGNSILVNAQDTLGGKLDSAFGQLDSINDDLSDLGEAVQGAVESANGKNVVHYEDHAPTSSDEGTEGDTWFVGQVGRPNDLVEVTNLATNPSFETNTVGVRVGGGGSGVTAYRSTYGGYSTSGNSSLWVNGPSSTSSTTDLTLQDSPAPTPAGKWVGFAVDARPGLTLGTNLSLVLWFHSGGSATSWVQKPTVDTLPSYGFKRVSWISQVPSGSDSVEPWVKVHGSSSSDAPPGGWRVIFDSVSLVVGDSQEDVEEKLKYFDGDTTDGATDNDPHYRWTGTPHASTSEKYLPALDIGDDGTWNVTEQYRFQSGEWVQVELSHTVLSSLDLGKLVAGSAAIKEAVVQKLFAEVVVARMSVADEFIGQNAILTGAVTAPKITASEELWAKIANFVKIRSEHIEADAIDGMVITAPTIQSARSGRRWIVTRTVSASSMRTMMCAPNSHRMVPRSRVRLKPKPWLSTTVPTSGAITRWRRVRNSRWLLVLPTRPHHQLCNPTGAVLSSICRGCRPRPPCPDSRSMGRTIGR